MNKAIYLSIIPLFLISCVVNDEDSIPDIPQKKEKQIQSFKINFLKENDEFSPDIDKKEFLQLYSNTLAHIHVNLSNPTEEFLWEIKSIYLCNIHQTGIFHYLNDTQSGYWKLQSEKSNLILHEGFTELAPGDSISLSFAKKILVIPQKVSAWDPNIHPTQSSGCYLLIHCRIGYAPYVDDTDYQIATPLPLHLEAGKSHTIHICVDTSAPLYDIGNDTPSLLFTPITFNPTTEDWKDAG